MKTIKLLLLLPCLFGILGCDNPVIEIPTGDRTFSCYVNGDLFLPRGNSGGVMPVGDGISILLGDDFYNFLAKDYRNYTIYFKINNPQLGSFNLEESDGLLPGSDNRDITHAIVRKNGVIYISKPGSGTITLDEYSEENRKGSFEFIVYRQDNPTKKLIITEGKFDD
ncbi:MAG: hypothetical protein Q4G27_07245 [Flavobacteriaceae bacterium]|nr:hypothetical protein [Flavobacteriaceae bacterium]